MPAPVYPKKRRIRCNVWGNTYGYEGTRRTQDFGLDTAEAEHWLKTGKRTPPPRFTMILRKATPPAPAPAPVFAGWQTESAHPEQQPAPTAEGTWIYTLTGSRVRVIKKRGGQLVFPAGEWSDEETPVSFVEAEHLRSHELSQHGFYQIFPTFDV